ncbi:MAG TPA: VWA domain-containing protein [Amycolatopsis sp.]|nr:VWA domain-containing protein [Amycolatopsis sp.]
MSLSERLAGFVRALREHGIPAGPGETVDAAAALEVLGLADRERVRAGLAASLLRGQGQRAVFDATFDLYFPLGVGAPERERDTHDDLDALRDRAADALVAGDDTTLAQVAAAAVNGFGRYGSEDAGGWSAHQTLEVVQPQTLLVRVLAAMRADTGRDAFTERLDRDEIRRRIERFREHVRSAARRRAAEVRGREYLARFAVSSTVDQVDFLSADRAQLAELRRAVRPLARKLATRLAARRRRAARGQIDLRRTLRRSLSTGGVPMRPAYRRRRPARPEIVLLCDLSGSVAGFAHFTMLLVQALADEFSRVRVFAFVDSTDEVTRLVAHGAADPAGLGARILAEARVTTWYGHSDYGNALAEFTERYGDAVGPRTSVLILGDARTNGGDPNLAAVRQLADQARRVFWLNPERIALWSTGDSAAHAYAAVVAMHECRNARQLADLVARILPI